MNQPKPAYKKIYEDLVKIKFPHKMQKCLPILEKADISDMDIIKLEIIIFGQQTSEQSHIDKRHRSYTQATIFEILEYQKCNNLTNTQVATHYGMSRNTIATWKKKFF